MIINFVEIYDSAEPIYDFVKNLWTFMFWIEKIGNFAPSFKNEQSSNISNQWKRLE